MSRQTGSQKTLLCIAPALFLHDLKIGLKGAGFNVLVKIRPPSKRGKDPYQIKKVIQESNMDFQGIILVVPKGLSPKAVIPYPIIDGTPIGILFASLLTDISPWLKGVKKTFRSSPSRWAIAAMLRDEWLKLGENIIQQCKKREGVIVEDLMSDETNTNELCHALTGGLMLSVYVGHGRSIGLCGYRGLRWHHIKSVPNKRTLGTFVAFSCDTLKWEGQPSFGQQMVMGGRSNTYVGAVNSISLDGNEKLAKQFSKILVDPDTLTIGDAMVKLSIFTNSNQLCSSINIKEDFSAFRLLGNPLQPLHYKIK